jgi:hypothetical protein
MESDIKIGILLLITTLAALLSGCATSQGTNNKTTLSGYIDTGTNKSIQ